MAYKKHPRHVTNEQFADNTTIDGDRLDSAMESFERHTNEVPQGDVATKWMPTMFVAGWIPQNKANTSVHHWPWLSTPNISDWVMAGSTVPDNFTNFERVKGYEIPGVNPLNPDHFLGSQYVWTTSFHITRPSIITNIDVLLLTDAIGAARIEYSNNFQYGADTPQGYAPNQASEDFSFTLHVDSPTGTENRMLNEVEVIRSQFVVGESVVSYKPWPLGFSDMSPAGFPGGAPSGVWEPISAEIPLHQNSRVRLSLVIPPAYTGSLMYDSSWGSKPWFDQHFTTVIHMLEEVV